MKRAILIVVAILGLVSCKKQSSKVENTINGSIAIKTENVNVESVPEFLNIFKNIKTKELHFYPPTFDKEGKIIKTPFEGIPINVERYKYFENKSIFFNIDAVKQGLCNIYAIGKFEINDTFIGLIIRQKSQYDETLIEIVLWNKNKRMITSSLVVADSFGDENWFFDTESWIKNFKYNNELIIVSRKKEKISKENCFSSNCDSIETDSFKLSQFRFDKFISKTIKVTDLQKYKLKLLK